MWCARCSGRCVVSALLSLSMFGASSSVGAGRSVHPAKNLNAITAAARDGSLGIYQTASETVLLADDFNQNAIDTTKWSTNNLFSGFTDPSVAVSDMNQQLQIGPLKQNATGSHYNGLRSVNTYNFTGAYCYVELLSPPSSSTAADAMLTAGTDVNNYYRIYVESGNLICQRRAGGAKTVLSVTPYNPSSQNFLRIRHDAASGNALFEAAADAGGGSPGQWTLIYNEVWNPSISLMGTMFEIKAGTWQAETQAPGTIVFDNFRAANASSSQTVPGFSHVYLLLEENHSYSSVIGNPVMPYLNGLASTYGVATNYFANAHPSIGNYFMLTTGQIITNDDSFTGTVSVDNIVRELTSAGKTWKTYAESLPSAGYLGGDQYPYLKHHNPMAYFSDCVNSTAQANNIVPFSQFPADLSAGSLPSFSFIVPNAQDDAHDCPQGLSTCTDNDKLAAADSWLNSNIAPFINSAAFKRSGLLIIVFDESVSSDTASGGGHVPAVVVSSQSKPGFSSSTFYQHQSTLRTACEALGISNFPGAAGAAPDMSEFFSSSPSEVVLLADDFSQSSIDTTKWSTNNLFSGFTDPSVAVNDVNQQLQIGPLKQNATGSHYNGLRSVNTYDFTGAYCYVELPSPPPSGTAADAMLAVGTDVNNYYRIYVESGNLICQRRAGGAKAVLSVTSYNPSSERFIRIRHDVASGNAVFEVAGDAGSGSPGPWTLIYNEAWNPSISLMGTIFEIKAGTWQAETQAPGTVIFDNFRAASQ